MFGRWPSRAAISSCLKPGAVIERAKGEKYWSERFQVPAGSSSDCEVDLAVAEDRAVGPFRFRPDRGFAEERRLAAAFEQDPHLGRVAVGAGAGLGALEQHVAAARRRPGPFPEDEVGGLRDPLEVRRRFAVPGAAAGDHVGEAVEGAAVEGVEVDRRVGVAGVEGLFRVRRDLLVGELDQRHVGVGAEQLVGGVAVLARVEHRLAVHDRQERLAAAPRGPGGPTGAVPEDQERRPDGARRRRPAPAPTRRRASGRDHRSMGRKR